MSSKKQVLLYSGGLDSFLTYEYLKTCNEEFDMVYFDTGARCCSAEVELLTSNEFIENIGKVNIQRELYFKKIEQEDAFIPNRNIITSVTAQGLKNYDVIYIGHSASDRVNDNNKQVFDKLSELLSLMYDKKITITSPFYDKHKCDLLKSFYDDKWNSDANTIPLESLASKYSFSCYNPSYEKTTFKCVNLNNNFNNNYITHECGSCPACFRKRVALYNAGLLIDMNVNECHNMIFKYCRESESKLKLIEVNDSHKYMKSRYESTVGYCYKLFGLFH